jgi:hypothetical protein
MTNTAGQNAPVVMYFDDAGIPLGAVAGVGLLASAAQAALQSSIPTVGTYGQTLPKQGAGPGLKFNQFSSAVPHGIAPSGTVATNGTYTSGTALPQIYGAAALPAASFSSPVSGNAGGGAYLYYPATAFATLPAGFYWTVFTSTTVGQVYSAGPGSGLVTGSNAGFTGATTAQAAVTLNMPANGMGGPNGTGRLKVNASTNNSAGAKTVSATFGGQTLFSQAVTTSLGFKGEAYVKNRGTTGAQLVSPNVAGLANGAQATADAQLNIDTTAIVAIVISLQIAVATDVLILDSYEWAVEQAL